MLSVIAVNRATQEMVGFILAQFIPAQKAEDTQLFYGSGPLYVCYVLTLGLVERYRRSGMGSILLRNCINQAKMNPDCGAVSVSMSISITNIVSYCNSYPFYLSF